MKQPATSSAANRKQGPSPRLGNPLADFQPDGFFVLRSPLLPFDTFEGWCRAAKSATTAHGLDRYLLDLAREPDIAEALFVASPSLSDGLSQLDGHSASPKKRARLLASLSRYLSRMMTRSTPFGLFAGGALGALGDGTRLILGSRRDNRRHTRLDMDYLYRLARRLETDHGIRSGLTYSPNSSLYRAAGRWRYAEGRLEGDRRTYHLVAVRDDEFLQVALDAARHGVSLQTIAQALIDADADPEGGEAIDREEAEAFVHELIDTQLLISDLGPRVTGPEPIHDLIERLSNLAKTEPFAGRLAEVREALHTLDHGSQPIDEGYPGAESTGVYRHLGQQLEPLGAEVRLPRLFQVDMGKPAPGLQLDSGVVTELQRAVGFLYRLRGPEATDAFTTFRQDFQQRFEPGRFVPLVEVLDEEVGIGFGRSAAVGTEHSPLLEGVRFAPSATSRDIPWSQAQDLISQKLFSTLHQGLGAMVWTDDDLRNLDDKPSLPLPDALQTLFSLLAPSAEAIDDGAFQLHLKSAGGPSGAGLLGRFCHGDEALAEKVREHFQREESHRPEAVFAEIVHLPEGRIGNILLRPVLRDYEIPFLGHSGAPTDRQLPIDDLLVSVVGQEVVLWSKRLDRRVLPRLTSAHNFSLRGLGMYRFLCSLQFQNLCAGLAWSWGPFETLPFLPRVRYRNTILSPAQWWVQRDEVLPWSESRGSQRQSALTPWREARKIPRRVLLADGDNELLVDFEHPTTVDAFLAIVRRRPSFRLLELLQDTPHLPVGGPEGSFAHEIILPLSRRPPKPSAEPGEGRRGRGPRSEPVPTHLPGSPWLYAKIYTGTNTADDLLQGPVLQLIQRYGHAIDRWFFIRYNDPQFHLRLRFHVSDLGLRLDLQQRLSEMASQWLSQGLIWDLQLAAYRPEIERYGGVRGLAQCERIFRADSEATLALLPHLRGDAGAEIRWLVTLASVDGLLRSLFRDAPDAYPACVQTMQRSFAAEFNADPSMRRGLSQKLRQHRPLITRVLAREGSTESAESSPLAAALATLATRDQLLDEPMDALRLLVSDRQLTVPLVHLGTSLAHMTVNRLIPADARAHEVVLYDFLHRHLLSQRARRTA